MRLLLLFGARTRLRLLLALLRLNRTIDNWADYLLREEIRRWEAARPVRALPAPMPVVVIVAPDGSAVLERRP